MKHLALTAFFLLVLAGFMNAAHLRQAHTEDKTELQEDSENNRHSRSLSSWKERWKAWRSKKRTKATQMNTDNSDVKKGHTVEKILATIFAAVIGAGIEMKYGKDSEEKTEYIEHETKDIMELLKEIKDNPEYRKILEDIWAGKEKIEFIRVDPIMVEEHKQEKQPGKADPLTDVKDPEEPDTASTNFGIIIFILTIIYIL